MENNTKKINISFIMPAYNCADTIKESVNSVINGNLEDGDEIVITDDFSSDNTPAIIKKLADTYPFIKTSRHSENRGGGATRNTAVKNSKNDLIFCLDSDNILEKNSVKKLKEFLISSRSDVSSFQELKFFKNDIKKITHSWLFKKGDIFLSDIFCSNVNPPASGNYLFTKKSWIVAGGYPESSEALDAWGFGFRQLATGSKMTTMPKSCYFHRIGHKSYWIRESKNKEKLSLLATDIVNPYSNIIKKEVLAYINNNKNNWFSDIGKIPDISCIETGKIIYPFKTKLKIILKKLIPFFIKKLIKKIYLYILFIIDFKNFKESSKNNGRFEIKWENRKPKLGDKTSTTSFDTHYIYHPAWAARIISNLKPELHIDISSILSFSTIISAFVPVKFYDYRPANINLSNMTTEKADLLSLPFADNSIYSLSCMHTVEHVGLGRYGDNIDPDADLKAINELKRVLAKGGNLLFVVPIGQPKLIFNAHRIYSYEQILNYFSEFTLKEFTLIPDNATTKGIIYNATKYDANKQNYACGCFWFTK